MTKSVMLRARMEPALKSEAEKVLAGLGLSPAEAIRLFYRQVSLWRGLPFEVRLPNVDTRKAVAEVRQGKGLRRHKSVASLLKPPPHGK